MRIFWKVCEVWAVTVSAGCLLYGELLVGIYAMIVATFCVVKSVEMREFTEGREKGENTRGL